MGFSMAFPHELMDKSCRISYKAEIVEVGDGGKG
jgi:hypothetical protein